jgi:hypothetical protein
MRMDEDRGLAVGTQADPTGNGWGGGGEATMTTKNRSQNHRARIPSPLPLRVAKTGRNHLNEEFTLLLPTGIGERF